MIGRKGKKIKRKNIKNNILINRSKKDSISESTIETSNRRTKIFKF
jgi:hypothetical protein